MFKRLILALLIVATLGGGLIAFTLPSPGFFTACLRVLGGLVLLSALLFGFPALLGKSIRSKTGNSVSPVPAFLLFAGLGGILVYWGTGNSVAPSPDRQTVARTAKATPLIPPVISTSVPRPIQIPASPDSTVHNTAPQQPPAQESAPDNWSYDQSTDDMRGTMVRSATAQSDNQLYFDFPYSGGSYGHLQVRQKAEKLAILLIVDKGQFMCNQFQGQTVPVKFDNGPIERYECMNAADGSANIIFLRQPARFLRMLKHSEHVVIEAEFFREGLRQITFQTSGLNWENN